MIPPLAPEPSSAAALRRHPPNNRAPLVLSASRWRNAALGIFCFFAAIEGGVMASKGMPSGWFVAAVFGAGFLAEFFILSPLGPRLRADESGLTVASMWRVERIAWSEIGGFGVYGRGRGGRVLLFLDPGPFATLRARVLVKGASGSTVMLPDAFGRRCEALAAELEARRQRALAARADSG